MSKSEKTVEARRLVDRFGEAEPSEPRHEILERLNALGAAAVAAACEGLRHGNWQVRRWCAIFLDHHADVASRPLLIPLLRDPKMQVRLWAVHSLACDRCKEGENPVDVVPLLVERIELDESARVRRMATAMLAYETLDARAVPVFQAILDRESDAKLRHHAGLGLMRLREAGLTAGG